jgi:hypothetical protein
MNAATAVSLVLCVATIVAWIVDVRVGVPNWSRVLQRLPAGASPWQLRTTEFGVWRGAVRWSRVTYYVGAWEVSGRPEKELAIDCWIVVLAAALLPIARSGPAVRAWVLRRRNAQRGLCPACGYDLRATPDRCPECGATPRPAPPPA